MMKILLVDDEKPVLDMLQNHICWDKLGLQVAGVAKNGRDALNKVYELNPDIVLTDIKMPIMNGIEFARKARAYDSNLKIIFLSGYDEFEFAKAAIDVEACGYVLKPIEQEELCALLEKVKVKCELDSYSARTAGKYEEACLRQLLHEESREKAVELVSKIETLAERSSILSKTGIYASVACIDNFTKDTRDMEESNILAITDGVSELIRNRLKAGPQAFALIPLENGRFCILVSEYHLFYNSFIQEWKLVKDSAQKAFNVSLSIGIHDKKGMIENVHELYKMAVKALNYKFYYGKAQVILSSAIKESPSRNISELKDLENELLEAIYRNDCTTAESFTGRYFDLMRTEKVDREIIRISLYNLLNSVYEYFLKFKKDTYTVLYEKSKILETLSYFDDILEAAEYITDNIHSVMDCFSGNSGRSENKSVVNKIINLLNHNYNRAFTSEDISRELYLNPNYIRTIFKEHTDETIVEYLTKIRMKKALELLADRKYKIHDISSNVGYENTSYFCSIFAKFYGMSPNEYRKKLL